MNRAATNGTATVRPPTRDDGFATVWAATAIAVLTTVMVAFLHLGSAVLARHRAEAAADLAALAAAGRAVAGTAPACGRAAQVVKAHGSTLTGCQILGWDALIEVSTPVPLALPGLDTADGRARAGPEPPATDLAPPPRAPPTPITQGRPPGS